MKALFFVVLFSAFQSFATTAPPTYASVDDASKVKYIEAVQTALAGKEISSCSNGGNYSLSQSIATLVNAQELFMNRTAQPVFIFRFQTSDSDYYDYTFKTTQDRKGILSFGFKVYKMMRVNKGDLLDPIFGDELVAVQEATCGLR